MLDYAMGGMYMRGYGIGHMIGTAPKGVVDRPTHDHTNPRQGSGPRSRPGRLLSYCYCMARTVEIPQELVLQAKTVSCGTNICNAMARAAGA